MLLIRLGRISVLFPSLIQKSNRSPISGLSFFTLSLVSVEQRHSFPIQIEQVIKSDVEKSILLPTPEVKPKDKRKRGRPKNPKRTIARIDTQAVSSASSAKTTTAAITEAKVDLTQMSGNRFAGLSQMTPVNQRTLFFSEDGNNFYITVQGNKPKLYTPSAPPDITVTEGNTERLDLSEHLSGILLYQNDIGRSLLEAPWLKDLFSASILLLFSTVAEEILVVFSFYILQLLVDEVVTPVL